MRSFPEYNLTLTLFLKFSRVHDLTNDLRLLDQRQLTLTCKSKTASGRIKWGSPKASHIKASHPHFPRFRVRIFRIFRVFRSAGSPQTLVFLG